MGEVIRGPWPARPVGSENHPAGRCSCVPPARHVRCAVHGDQAQPAVKFRWRSEYPSDVEARRAALLESRPHCPVCERPFPNYLKHLPKDGICRDCRAEADRRDRDQGGLF